MGVESEINQQSAFMRNSVGVATMTLLADTSIYAAGDVLSDTAILQGVAPAAGGSLVLRSIEVLDEDDQGVALDIVFLDSLVSLGTFNAAPSISDANARSILGIVSVPAANFIDLGGARVATVLNIGLVLKAAAASSDLYVATITRGGTPTYSAAGLKVKFGFNA